jgi:hypothetical protein
MLKDGFVLTVICLIVVGAIFAWWTTSSPHYYGAPVESRFLEPEPAPPPPVVAKTTHRPLQPVPEPVTVPMDLEVSPSPIAVAPALVEKDPPPFPSVEQIAAGAHGDTITGKYGNPALSAVTSTRGHMIETFIYARDRGRSATIIRLEDGKVAAAFSQTQPLAPTGLSAPRRWQNQ